MQIKIPPLRKNTPYTFLMLNMLKTAAKQAGKLFTLDIEHPMTLNDLAAV